MTAATSASLLLPATGISTEIGLHGTYHRGNAGAVLQLKGITPSRDSITDFLEDAPGSDS
jgi:hypothetical protein